MIVKEEIAITLRAVRELKGVRPDALAGTISQNNLSMIEQGKTLATLSTLIKVAECLDMHILSLLALALAQRTHDTPEHELQKALEDVRRFRDDGGLHTMEHQKQDGELKKRARGTKANVENVQAVLKLKELGKTQKETARELGLPPTTVHRYWTKE
ncbi:helix-turn-helix domain-containing protein [Pseudomonas sp. TWP3-1]|uniref:helix-turn-helix domain-containing protein n=1 Tax=Pseudomonas sp. TWP3-1 TaxID=2804631 RepID=UPI003CF6A7BD